jgi:osmotically-inducible protein OsmY
MARDETQKLAGTLGAADRHKMDEYLDSIREIEHRIEKAETDGRNIAPSIDKPAGIPALYSEHAKLLFDLQFVAFQSDLTRVTTMVMGREGSVRTYDEIGVSDPHHPLSHHRNIQVDPQSRFLSSALLQAWLLRLALPAWLPRG